MTQSISRTTLAWLLAAAALFAAPAAFAQGAAGYPEQADPDRRHLHHRRCARHPGAAHRRSADRRMGPAGVVDNKPGAGGNTGADFVAKSPGDGYTLVLGTVGTHSINGALYAKMPYDMVKDFAPVTLLATTPNLLVVHNDVPAKTLAEFIALGKKEGKMTFASAGSGTSIHVSGELFKTMTGIDMTHIPYKGRATAIPDLLGGRVTMMFDNMPSSLPLVKEGKLRALGVTSAQRSAAAPDIPTIAEQGLPGFEAVSWFAMFAPAGTPKPVLDKLQVPGEEDPAVARGRQAPGRDRPRGRRLDARGAGRLPARGDREMGQGGEGLGREGRMMSGARKVCVVTGSSSGIGAATARLYAKNGWNVVVNYSREVGPAEAVAEECSPPGPTRSWSRPTSRSMPIAAAWRPRSKPGSAAPTCW